MAKIYIKKTTIELNLVFKTALQMFIFIKYMKIDLISLKTNVI